MRKPTFFEFFAGGGMVRAGLGAEWQCAFANDFDAQKAATYRDNWDSSPLRVADIGTLTTSDLPGAADMAWASFPCQDLSLAGVGAGLGGSRSGTFFRFWKLMTDLGSEMRSPKLIVLENVCGALTSHGGRDFVEICNAYVEAGYRFGAMVVDAAKFLPQSRPRLFFVGVRGDVEIPQEQVSSTPDDAWHSPRLLSAWSSLSTRAKLAWVWWAMPSPPKPNQTLSDILEDDNLVSWHEPEKTARLLAMMSPRNLSKVREAQRLKTRKVGGVYRRTRFDQLGAKVQRAEVRFDDTAGCLRTPAGGSSRQIILVVERDQVRSRLISARETARLMGLPDQYRLPSNYNEAYHLTGDGVAVPVVRHLAENIFAPILGAHPSRVSAAA